MRRILLAAAGLAIVASPAIAQKYNLTVAGYSPGGLVSTIGIGMDKALAKAFPGSAVTYQTGSGGYSNAILLTRKKVPVGFIGDHEMSVIMAGKPPRPPKDWTPRTPSSGGDGPTGGTPAVAADPAPTVA